MKIHIHRYHGGFGEPFTFDDMKTRMSGEFQGYLEVRVCRCGKWKADLRSLRGDIHDQIRKDCGYREVPVQGLWLYYKDSDKARSKVRELPASEEQSTS